MDAVEFASRIEGLRELAPEILEALSEHDGWVNGDELAKAVTGSVDSNGTGSWRRASKQLRDRGLIDTDQKLGYRLTEFACAHFAATSGPD